jgi:hypothetical protein
MGIAYIAANLKLSTQSTNCQSEESSCFAD